MLRGDFLVNFSQKTTIGSSVHISCTSIGATVRHEISSIYSDLAPEDPWTGAAHAWVFLEKLVRPSIDENYRG